MQALMMENITPDITGTSTQPHLHAHRWATPPVTLARLMTVLLASKDALQSRHGVY